MADLNTIGGIHYEIMRRCYNEKSVMYSTYGAKGISVCEEWHNRENFKKWCKQNGFEKGMRLQRIDSSKNYCPENCFFGTMHKKKGYEAERRKFIKEHRKHMKEFAGIKGNYCKHTLYGKYNNMLARCNNPNNPHYNYYGGRGIKVCELWSGKDGFFFYYKWAIENGWREGLTIDRIDCNGDYEPNNCRWVTTRAQQQNKRNINKMKYKGQNFCIIDLAKILNFNYEKFAKCCSDANYDTDSAIMLYIKNYI